MKEGELDEIHELEYLFQTGGSLKESNLPVSLYAKLEVFEENRRKAEATRKERKHRAIRRQEHAMRRSQRSRALRERTRGKHMLAMEEHRAAKHAVALSTREQEAQWQEQLVEEKQQFVEKARKKVLGAKKKLKRMRRAEDNTSEARRAEGRAQRIALELAAKEKAAQLTQSKSGVVNAVKEQERQGALKVDNFRYENKVRKAADIRLATQQWKLEKQRAEEEYLAIAEEKKKAAQAGRAVARRRAEEVKQANSQQAHAERDIDVRVQAAKARVLARNQVVRMERYKQRFASQDEANEFGASQLKSMYKYVD
ncbi:hypothetical protein AB1Y20_009555 [Prymnesium parvum]|uniref:Trichohyalin-plectin-homology domain-containing protein n=1 Tax=Prymnesium parvum TaxID=97485 RepID=A0AB34K5E8_PRYPA|mmetsp:Transcript_37380/g.91058  ORF Transcript_37380/g.91058 Transcript_37380/m.91058 type:complete len:312 (+) Transcript_37380:161-1096(+)